MASEPAPEPAALPTSDPPSTACALPEGRVSYVDEGPRDAPALLTVHGVPGSVRDFRYLAPQLSDRVRVVRVDLPGFGGSDPIPAAVDGLSGRLRVLLALADRLGLQHFGVLGHSLGGGTALVLAAEHPERVGFLALVNSVGLRVHRGIGRSPRAFRLFARGLRVPLLGGLLLERLRAVYRERRFPGADELDRTSASIHMRAVGAADFGRFRRAVARGLPPTLLAYARDDALIEREISEELARAIPGARVLAFEEGGHNLQKTRVRELAGGIKELLGA